MINLINSIDNLIWFPIMIILIGTGLYFTIKLNFVQLHLLPEAIRTLFNKEENKDKSTTINPVQAFLVGLASRIGAGNITGVATAILVGGPGAIFWMWLVALLVASSAFVESTLGQVYKEKEKNKGFVGGPSYYMKKGLNIPKIGVLFSVILIGCYAYSFVTIQSNTVTSILKSTVNNSSFMFAAVIGIILAVLTAVILFGGAKRIVKVSALLVPIMSVGYLILAVLIIILNIERVPYVLNVIISQAFSAQAVTGATIGGIILTGARRGMFSNEAGMGSAPNAAATATTSHPVKQGLVQMFGVYIDTLVICTATGLIILLSLSNTEFMNYSNQALNDPSFNAVVVTQASLINSLGEWSGYLLTLFIFFFTFSSILGNYYYSESAYEYLTASKGINIFKISVIFFVFYGAVANMQTLWTIADIFMGIMAFLNLIAISFLFKIVKQVKDDYCKQKKAGKDPLFLEQNIEGLSGTIWTSEKEIFNEK
ncbi:MAG: alanine/glycine:cation symporter family protein [Mycoplasmatales bacterium]